MRHLYSLGEGGDSFTNVMITIIFKSIKLEHRYINTDTDENQQQNGEGRIAIVEALLPSRALRVYLSHTNSSAVQHGPHYLCTVRGKDTVQMFLITATPTPTVLLIDLLSIR